VASLRAEVAALLADALRSDELHDAAMADAQTAHDEEMATATAAHEHEVDGLQQALATRDLIGQAKGVIMAAMHCTPEHAFALLVKQSQAQNRKLVDIAAEITDNVQRRRGTAS
jgi:AmiR/NasT family two-component response regulator